MKRSLLLHPLLATLLLTALPATARDWQVDAAKSTLTFKGSYQGGPFEGKFKKFEATIAYDETNLAQAKFDVKVDTGSADSQSSERDETLRSADFFNVAKFPQAHFVTGAFAKNGDAVEAKGTLTIRDQSKPVTLKVKFAASGDSATLDVDTIVNRGDFGLGNGDDWKDIAKDVAVHGHLVLSGK